MPLAGRNKLSKLDLDKNGNVTVYSSDTTNNGIMGYTCKEADYKVSKETPTYLIFGDHTKSMNIATSDFCVMDNVKVLIPFNQNIKTILFICAVWIKTIPNLGYARHWSKAEKSILKLPTLDGVTPDYEYMENFIIQLESEQSFTLKSYLLETGLINYILTAAEQKALNDFKKGNIIFTEYNIGDLFEIKSYKKRFDANKVVISESGHPYVVRTSSDNGVRGYVHEDEEFLNEGNTISFGQDTATMFYQKEPYFTGDKIKILKSKESNFNKKNGLYFITTMGKTFSGFSWGGQSFDVKIISKQKIKVPVSNQKPNYILMDTLISAIQKLIIKDVVLYVEEKINYNK